MAEGFARKYGVDVMDVASAGLSPISFVDPLTVKTMKDWGIDISGQYPKSMADAPFQPWDLIVNMSGLPMPSGFPGQLLVWNVRDPFRLSEQVFQEVARHVEGLVQALVLALRRANQ
jgi:protein-tyrosine-phosphatase